MLAGGQAAGCRAVLTTGVIAAFPIVIVIFFGSLPMAALTHVKT